MVPRRKGEEALKILAEGPEQQVSGELKSLGSPKPRNVWFLFPSAKPKD